MYKNIYKYNYVLVITYGKEFINRHQIPVFFFVLALFIRLTFNFYTMPMETQLGADMSAYNNQANLILENPWQKSEGLGFYPLGLDLFLAILKAIFGKTNFTAISFIFSILSAFNVVIAYAIACRVSKNFWVPIIVGLISLIDINKIFLTGFLLPQIPFAFFLSLAVLCLIKCIDNKNIKYGYMFSILLATAAFIRPEILIFIFLSAAYFCFGFLTRKYNVISFNTFSKIYFVLFISLVFYSSIYNFYSIKPGVLSNNGVFNLVYGRCHNTNIVNYHLKVSNGVPCFFMADNYQQELAQTSRKPISLLMADPALGRNIEITTSFYNMDNALDLVKSCIETTGYLKQIKYSLSNIIMLWQFNLWPANYLGDLKLTSSLWNKIYNFYFALPSILSLLYFLWFYQRNQLMTILALNYLSVVILAAIVFGTIRIRTPYDFAILIMVVEFGFIGWDIIRNKIKTQEG